MKALCLWSQAVYLSFFKSNYIIWFNLISLITLQCSICMSKYCINWQIVTFFEFSPFLGASPNESFCCSPLFCHEHFLPTLQLCSSHLILVCSPDISVQHPVPLPGKFFTDRQPSLFPLSLSADKQSKEQKQRITMILQASVHF
jgi:hypothetical protein